MWQTLTKLVSPLVRSCGAISLHLFVWFLAPWRHISASSDQGIHVKTDGSQVSASGAGTFRWPSAVGHFQGIHGWDTLGPDVVIMRCGFSRARAFKERTCLRSGNWCVHCYGAFDQLIESQGRSSPKIFNIPEDSVAPLQWPTQVEFILHVLAAFSTPFAGTVWEAN